MKMYRVVVVKGDIFKLEEELNWLAGLGANIVSVMYISGNVYQIVYSHSEWAEVEDIIGE